MNAPGLTMSRSIGDSVAKEIGVISTPEVTVHKLSIENDLFLVLASDGIWDSMDNEDVINYIEFYREKSCKKIHKTKETASVHNSCIAQLLCEEARVRWLSIVQEEDVGIDDISCIILEINKGTNDIELNQKNSLNSPKFQEIDENCFNDMLAPSNNHMNDPKRGSQINISLNLQEFNHK